MPEAKPGLVIADDDASIRLSMSQILTEVGYRVRAVAEGRAALAEIRREAPEVLLSDLNMPGMSGFELLPVVRREFPRIRLVAMSGAFSGEDIPLGAPADAFYSKGAGVTRLLGILESFSAQEPIATSLPDVRAPIWMTRRETNSADEDFVTIECPNCLRIFPQTLNGPSKPICETDCAFCGCSIRYAVMRPPTPANFRPLERRQSPSKHLSFRTVQKRMH